jgi:hypothetical protein
MSLGFAPAGYDGTNPVSVADPTRLAHWRKAWTNLTAIIATFVAWLVSVDTTVPLGTWVDVPYSAANFSSSNGSATWTVASGDQVIYRYMVIGKLMWLQVVVKTTTLSGFASNDTLRFAIPGGYVAADSYAVSNGRYFMEGWFKSNTGDGGGPCVVDQATNTVGVIALTPGWINSTDLTDIGFTVLFEVK